MARSHSPSACSQLRCVPRPVSSRYFLIAHAVTTSPPPTAMPASHRCVPRVRSGEAKDFDRN